MRALVTGACGFVGKHLIPTLEENGFEIVTIDKTQNDQPSKTCEYLMGDISRSSILEKVLGHLKMQALRAKVFSGRESEV